MKQKHMTANKHEKLLNSIRKELGKLGSPIDGKVITLVDDQWRIDGSFMNPLSLFAVVNKNGGDWEWLDLLSGRWSGVVNQQCLTQNQSLAGRIAIMYQADVEKYSLVHNP